MDVCILQSCISAFYNNSSLGKVLDERINNLDGVQLFWSSNDLNAYLVHT